MTDINWTPQDTYYVYNADTYCQDCGKSIQNQVMLDDWSDTDMTVPFEEWQTHPETECDNCEYGKCPQTYEDSNCFPQATYRHEGEADAPDHCGNMDCQRFLGISLTSDGILYVQESASEDLERDGKVGDVVQGWLDYYGIEEVTSND